MANIQTSVCALQYSKETELGVSPQPKLGQKCSDFSFQQLPNPWFIIFHVGRTAHLIHSSFLPALYPLSLAFLLIFWSPFSPASLFSFHFPFPQILSCHWEYSAYLGFFPFYNHRVLSSLSLPTLWSSSLHIYPHLSLVNLAQEPWEIQASSKGKSWQCSGGWSADQAQVSLS